MERAYFSMDHDFAYLENKLLNWYDTYQRALSWRALPGYTSNPYHVWLSEIMLQQTTVVTVQTYFKDFITRWPTIEDLAAASLDEVFHLWQGLGYYSRARNLHQCAQRLVKDFNGLLPQEEKVLLTLPGIGPYTASAIAAIAYGRPTLPVDGNIVRVFARLFALKTRLPALKKEIMTIAQKILPSCRSGDVAQSLMDLGATICRPRNPDCAICPLHDVCQGRKEDIASELPYPAIKGTKPHRYGVVFWIEDPTKKIMLERRPEKGLLAGLIGLPTTEWRDRPWDLNSKDLARSISLNINIWEHLPVTIHHTFTHFHLHLKVMKGQTKNSSQGIWSTFDDLSSYAFPTLMKKVIRMVSIGHIH